MYDSQSKGISYTAGFFMLIAFAIGGVFIAGFIGIEVWKAMTGKSYEQFSAGMTDPAYTHVYKIVQALNMLGFLIPAIVTAHMLHKRPMKLLGFTSRISVKQIVLACLIMGAAIFIGSALSHVNHQVPIPADWKTYFDKMEASYNQQTQAILRLTSTGDYILALVVMGFLPALCEETLFRGGLQNFLTRSTRNPWLSIIVVSLLFSIAHISFYGFLFRFFLGCILGCIFHYSGKLWLCVLGHFINNALAITAIYYYLQKGRTLDAMREETGSYWGLLLLPVLFGFFMLFKRESAHIKLDD